MLDQTSGKIFTSKTRITSSGLDFIDTVFNDKKRYTKGSCSEIEDEDSTLVDNPVVETISDGSSSGLVDDTEDVEAGNGSNISGRLTMRAVEGGRDGDDGPVDAAPEIRLGCLLHLVENHG